MAESVKVDISTTKTIPIKILIDVLTHILTEITCKFTTKYIELIPDIKIKNHIFVRAFLYAENFEEYKCLEPTNIGIKMANFHKIINTLTNKNTIRFLIDDPKYLNITIDTPERGMAVKHQFNLIDKNASSVDNINKKKYSTIIRCRCK
jgi:hypothetical protein